MLLNFFKFHGTGNDFIIINCMNERYNFSKNSFILKTLCNRNIGIGADGIIFIHKNYNCDFYMEYYNSNGKESTMCGNGGRCAIAFSKKIGNSKSNEIFFKSIDGYHKGIVDNYKNDIISLQLTSLKRNNIKKYSESDMFLNTGSPHHIVFVNNLKNLDVYNQGRYIRHHKIYMMNNGVNVNFVKINHNILQVRTYERGVENETLSCGTGVVASVIASFETNRIKNNKNIEVSTLGGILWVSFIRTENMYHNIYLTGPVKLVFKGLYYL
ncbi:diaminopimelate epimerase [Blattabacterium cuenoti]|uniref:diaminopimelate epimerase n=1 Tax=Blattabacterium cuenoti TaxID=1653831 RepID=UPI00163C635C|nr:diaminopimelate epimerase [Blattabacterium cuenoti]